MKKTLLTLLLIVGFISTQAQELTWHTEVSKAVTVSNNEKKPIMLFFTGSDWCGWCMRLQKQVFRTPEFAKWAKDNVVLVELDYPRRKQLAPELASQNELMQQMFEVRGFPTVWFIMPGNENQELKKLGRTGYVDGGPEKWLEGANNILSQK